MCPWAYQTSRVDPRGPRPDRARRRAGGSSASRRSTASRARSTRGSGSGRTAGRCCASARCCGASDPDAARRVVRAGRPGAARRGPQAAPAARSPRQLLAEIGLDPGVVDEAHRRPDDARRGARRARPGRRRRRVRRADAVLPRRPVPLRPGGRRPADRRRGARACGSSCSAGCEFPQPVRDPAAEGAGRPGAHRRDVPAVPRRPATGSRSRTRRPDGATVPTIVPKDRPSPPSTRCGRALDDAAAPASTTPTGRGRRACPAGTSRPSSPTSSAPSRCCSASRRRPSRSTPSRARTCATTSAGSTRRGSRRWRRTSPAERARAVPRPRRASARDALGAMTDDAWDAESGSRPPARTPTGGSCASACSTAGCTSRTSATPSAGRATRPARPSRLALDEMAVGHRLRRRQEGRRAAGLRVPFELTGPAARTIDVEVAERAAVVDELSGPPTRHADDARRRVRPARRRPRRSGRRVRDQVTIDGDTELGEQIVANLAYTI